MTPKENQIQALKESVEHWRRLSTGQRRESESIGISDCACCALYYTKGQGCEGCPIAEHTKQPFCRNTPYYAVQELVEYYEDDDKVFDNPEFRRLAREELDFLKALYVNLTM